MNDREKIKQLITDSLNELKQNYDLDFEITD